MSSATALEATPCSAAGSSLAVEEIALADIDFSAVGTRGPLARNVQGFSWLRDLAASASRDKGARLAEAIAGRWLIAHGTRVDEAWAPELWGERILFWTAYAPYILSSRDAGYRSALLNTLARGARHLDADCRQGAAGHAADHRLGRRPGCGAYRAGRLVAPVASGIGADAVVGRRAI